jgi:hypothetical protein
VIFLEQEDDGQRRENDMVVTQQESEYENPEKLAAREENVRIYRALTGRTAIPEGKQYWTLAALQSTRPESEIEQMVALGLCTKEQFYGLDEIVELTEQNKVNHPTAHWFSGEWCESIARLDFKPELIYLDLTSMADSQESADITYRTIKQCPPDTVLLVNVALNNTYTGHKTTIDELLEHVTDKLTEAEVAAWNFEDFPMFTYNGSGRTVMCTVGLRRTP